MHGYSLTYSEITGQMQNNECDKTPCKVQFLHCCMQNTVFDMVPCFVAGNKMLGLQAKSIMKIALPWYNKGLCPLFKEITCLI
jgi:hypothetical protein